MNRFIIATLSIICSFIVPAQKLTHIQIVLDSSSYSLYFPEYSKGSLQPKGGYENYLNVFMESVKKEENYNQLNANSEITFTVFKDGSINYFSTKAEPTQMDSLFIEKLDALGSWATSKIDNQRVSISIISSEFLVFTRVEEPAAFPGGIQEWVNYLNQNLTYPVDAHRMGIQGRVFVQFIVEKDGSLSDIKVVKGIGAGCDEETVRVLKEGPNWNPGMQRGQPVRQKMIQNVLFKIPEPAKELKKEKSSKRKRKNN